MAQLDRFLTALTEYRAEALVLEQDQTPSFRFISGTKSVSKQTLPAERILELVTELTPGSGLQDFEDEGTSSFMYQLGGLTYSGIVEQDSGQIVATIWEATQSIADGVGEDTHDDPLAGIDAVSNATADTPAHSGQNASAPSTPEAGPPVRTTPAPSGEIQLPTLGPTGVNDLIPDDLPPNYRADMEKLLRGMIENDASDLHLCVGERPFYRIDGEMRSEDSWPELEAETLFRMIFSIAAKRHRDEFMRTKDTDCAYSIEGLSRYRCNFFFDRNGPGAVFRAIPNEIVPRR